MKLAIKSCLLLAVCICSFAANTNGRIIRQKRDAPSDGSEHGEGQGEGHGPDKKVNLPETMQMDVPVKGSTVRLNLERSDAIDATLPVFIGTDKYAFTQMDNRDSEDFVVYQDVSKRASFIMWNSTHRGGSNYRRTLGMRGTFDEGGETFSMEPLAMRETRSRMGMDPVPGEDSEPVIFQFLETDFAMTTVNRSDLLNPLEEQVVNNKTQSILEDVQEYMNKTQEEGHQYPRFYYEVELFLVVDYAIFNKWLRASSARDYATRELEAIDDIRFYFAHILNGVAMRYRSVDEVDFQIRVIPVGLFIAKTPSASFWTESYPVKEAYHYTEAYKALDLFEEWINDERANLPPFDQASLFSGNNLFNGYYNGRRRTINGLASITGICGYTRASLNYDQGQYGSIQNAAHELGHNLGSYHDGYNNNCESSEQYIMATSPGVLTDRNFDNVFEFSYCSKRSFWDYLLYLNGKDANCLLERTNTDSYWNYDYFLQTHVGQRYTADEQCKLVYGTQSSYCGGGDLDEGICSTMYCWRPQEGDCYTHIEQRAADATPCGDRKWCMEGLCVYDSRAPTIPNPECIYGDYLDIVDRVNNYRCEDIGRVANHLCYNDDRNSRCCETCERIRRKDNPQCEFGDRNPSYCNSRVEAKDCYNENTRRECCKTCEDFYQDVPNCEYGDRSLLFCRDAANQPRDCYSDQTYKSACCDTCPKLVTGPKDCEFGDRNSWCRDIRNKNQCYDTSYAKSCCKTCTPDGPPGCEFGDRSDYCRQEDCSDPNKRQDCCKTCSSYAPPSGGGDCPNEDHSDCKYWIYAGSACYNHENSCCRACQQYQTDIPQCKFGDHYSWCGDYVNRYKGRVCTNGDAYILEKCCESCAQYVGTGTDQGTDNCSDKADWCSNVQSHTCYDRTTEETCCARCKSLKKSSTSCPYGDRFSWCKPEYCGSHASECCETC